MKILLLFGFFLLSVDIFAQSAVERVAKAINQNDLFALQREYGQAKDSLPVAIAAMAKVKLGVSFNNLQVDRQLFSSIKRAGQDYGMEHFMHLGFLISWHLHRQNLNKEAIENLDSMLIVCKDRPEYIEIVKSQRKQYAKYAGYSLYRFKPPVKDIHVALQVDTVGEGGLHFSFPGKVNDAGMKFSFDTGATTNVISREIAAKYPFLFLHDTMNFAGLEHLPNEMVLVDSISIGGLTVYNVPFCVMDLKAGNTEADQTLERIKVICGQPLINAIKEIQLNIKDKQLIVPAKPTPKTSTYSNIYWEPGGYIVLETMHSEKQMLFLLDSGSGGSSLSSNYYLKNLQHFQAAGKVDSIGFAGVGGVVPTAFYWVPDFQVELAGKKVIIPRIMAAENTYFKHLTVDRGVFGADLLMNFSKVILNMKEMFMQVETK